MATEPRARLRPAVMVDPKLRLMISGLLLAGCSHVIHDTYVRPGVAVGAETGMVVERIVPGAGSQGETHAPTQTYPDLQLHAGYGWRFDTGRAFSLTLVVPTRAPVLTRLDAYWLLGSGPLDLGIGVLVGYGPEAYLQLGHRFETAGLELSAGVRGPIFTTYALLTMGAGETFRIGLWGEYQNPDGVWKRCDENCEDLDYLDYGFAGGLTISVRVGAPAAAPVRATGGVAH